MPRRAGRAWERGTAPGESVKAGHLYREAGRRQAGTRTQIKTRMIRAYLSGGPEHKMRLTGFSSAIPDFQTR